MAPVIKQGEINSTLQNSVVSELWNMTTVFPQKLVTGPLQNVTSVPEDSTEVVTWVIVCTFCMVFGLSLASAVYFCDKRQLPENARKRKVQKIVERKSIGHQETVDIQQLPNAVAKGHFKPVLVPGETAFVTFDLETTGLIEGRVMPQITQIAATELKTGDKYNTYVMPTIPINSGATDVTGISMVDGVMKMKGEIVHHVPVITAIEQWITWLEKFKNVCLVAHNGRRFDFPILVTTLKNVGLSCRFPASAFVDSLSVFRKLYPKGSHSQQDLVSSLLGSTYEAHNAMADVVALGQLINFINLPQKDLLLHSFSPSAVSNQMCFLDQKAANISSLDPLVSTGVCKRPTAENIAGSGLKLAHLQLVYSRGGEDGLRDVFTAKNSEGLPRVTGSKKVLEDVIPKLVAYFEN